MGLASLIVQQIARGLRRVSRCVQHFDLQLPDSQHFPILRLMDRVVRRRAGSEDDLRSRRGGQIEVSRYEVRMEVRLKDVLDLRIARRSHRQSVRFPG